MSNDVTHPDAPVAVPAPKASFLKVLRDQRKTLVVATVLSWPSLQDAAMEFQASVRQPALTAQVSAPPSAVTYREASPNGGIISLDEARSRVATFNSQAVSSLTGGLESGRFGAGSYQIYYLESPTTPEGGESTIGLPAARKKKEFP